MTEIKEQKPPLKMWHFIFHLQQKHIYLMDGP
jgi:hypothetical protein